jgi:acetate CoA/acetoacetate CoA-transferase alpha subunit
MAEFIDMEKILEFINDDSEIMIGGFGGCGTPKKILKSISAINVSNLTIITNDASFPDIAHGILLAQNKVKKMICSHIGTNKKATELYNQDKFEVEFIPQGTFIERIRAAGFGIGAFYTPTGVGTEIAQGKEKRILDGKEYILEKPLRADLCIIKAYKADKYGNLIYRGTARNFNPIMATAANTVIVEVDEIVDEIDHNNIITPGVLVDYILNI